MRPMFSPALLRTALPRMLSTSWLSTTAAGVPIATLPVGTSGFPVTLSDVWAMREE